MGGKGKTTGCCLQGVLGYVKQRFSVMEIRHSFHVQLHIHQYVPIIWDNSVHWCFCAPTCSPAFNGDVLLGLVVGTKGVSKGAYVPRYSSGQDFISNSLLINPSAHWATKTTKNSSREPLLWQNG